MAHHQDPSDVAVVQSLFACFAAGDADGIRRLMSPTIEWVQMPGFPGGGTFQGPDAIFENVFAKLRREWIGWKSVPREFVQAGDRVLVLGHYEATWPSTGRSFRAEFAHLYKVRDGLIVSLQQFTDTRVIADAMK
jgi:ketosteroid isomerase-like protein